MKSLFTLGGSLLLVAISTMAIGVGGEDTTRIVTIGERTGPAFYSVIEGRYLFVDGGSEAIAVLTD